MNARIRRVLWGVFALEMFALTSYPFIKGVPNSSASWLLVLCYFPFAYAAGKAFDW